MSIFPQVTTLPDFVAGVGDKPEIRFMPQSNGAIVGCYLVSDKDTFNTTHAKECRGIVFDPKGNIISRPLHKFHNVGEKPETVAENIDWAGIVRVMDKRDGSMIHTVKYFVGSDGWMKRATITSFFELKSKKSFESDVVKQARSWMLYECDEELATRYVDFCNWVTVNDKTAIFEWTAPTARIVVGYREPGLHLLHVRDNVTGEYEFNINELAARFGIPTVTEVDPTILAKVQADPAYVHELVQSVEGIEGWIFQHKSGEMYKLKTKWYMDRHRAMTFLRVRDIARLVLDEGLDDLKAQLVGDGIDVTQIEEIESRVVKQLTSIEQEVAALYVEHKDLDRKSYALKFGADGSRHKYFQLLMAAYTGPVDVKGYFIKNILDEEYDLTQLNLTDSVAEVE